MVISLYSKYKRLELPFPPPLIFFHGFLKNDLHTQIYIYNYGQYFIWWLSLALQKQLSVAVPRLIHTSDRNESSSTKLGRFRQIFILDRTEGF